MTRRSSLFVSVARKTTTLFAAMALLPGMTPVATGGQMDQRSPQAEQSCVMKMDFSDPDTIQSWQVVNDGVMGGLSQGTRFAEDGHMVFQGVINTNGGGFSSIRARLQPGDLAGADGMRLSLRPDGRAYRLTFRTSERWRGRSVSYQAAIPVTASGEQVDIFVPFDDMETSVFGRRVRAAPFDPSDVREIGIILADGRDGPFRLELSHLSCAFL